MAAIPRTPTTTDPLVASIFAVHCLNVGKGVVLLARKSDFSDKIQPGNFLSTRELEIGLEVQPAEFEARSCLCVSAHDALDALAKIGFADLPVRIAHDHLEIVLEDLESRNLRLNQTQIVEFNRLVMS